LLSAIQKGTGLKKVPDTEKKRPQNVVGGKVVGEKEKRLSGENFGSGGGGYGGGDDYNSPPPNNVPPPSSRGGGGGGMMGDLMSRIARRKN
jgi:hypothetical protein